MRNKKELSTSNKGNRGKLRYVDVDCADVFLPLSKQTERKQRFAHKYTTHESIHVYKLNAKDIDLRVFFLRDGEEKYNFE